MFNDSTLDKKSLLDVMNTNLTGSFNGNGFDLYILEYALRGATNAQLKKLCNAIITDPRASWMVAKDFNVGITFGWDHIDIMQVPIGQASLKIYAGRLNAPKLQNLPIPPDKVLTRAEADKIKKYCVIDLDDTELLFKDMGEQLKIRIAMSEQYGMDLRSKSDAQIAESVIKSELNNLTGKDYRRPSQRVVSVEYKDPKIINFKTRELRTILSKLIGQHFKISTGGQVVAPNWIVDQLIKINGAYYQMGIGGLHSCEKQQYIVATPNTSLFEIDAKSFYPFIIMQQKLAPPSMGEPFLMVYKPIIDRRLCAKKDGDYVTAETLKIVVNGSFGKFGSKWSSLYAPNLLIQTTITGQLALLMLIERLELERIKVVSANTDGIVVHCAKSREHDVSRITKQWELETTFQLDRTDYLKMGSRDVNNYIAIKTDGSAKGKGIFAPRSVGKNPEFLIVYDAVTAFISNGTAISKTIRQSYDITRFVAVRTVTGGAVYEGEQLGKAIRYYYSHKAGDEPIRYFKNNNKVPKSDGARPLMDMPKHFPYDVNFEKYEELANDVLKVIGYA
jgi:hypothetical protein